MTGKDINNWIMYHEIHQLARLGFSKARISRHLVIDPRTVGKYLGMSEHEYEQFLIGSRQRSKKLNSYEEFVKDKLLEFPDTPTAQMHDWLKEHHPDFPEVSPRTVYNFVMFVRGEYNIPVVAVGRDYFPVQELPWGEQAQVDFGQYNMRRAGGGRKRVWFFVMVLSRSRMKYLWFSDSPFTAPLVCQGHEQGFMFFAGMPATIVYDLDRIMVVDENMGEVLLTSAFKAYVSSAGFKLHFCRKADPESKGKVENVVGYIKKNFLYNRAYEDLDALNSQALGWLGRTANLLPHNVTKQSPQSQHQIEQEYLRPYRPIPVTPQMSSYHVRKNNTISYKSNFYSLPEGAYRGRGTQVLLKQSGDTIALYSTEQVLLCMHPLATGKGQTIINTNHRRDTSQSLDVLISQAIDCFTHSGQAKAYLGGIKERLPRYLRDHVQCIIKALKQTDTPTADRALAFCLTHELYSGSEFEQVLSVHRSEVNAAAARPPMKLLNAACLEKAAQTPQASDIQDYETIINPTTPPSL